MSDEVKYIASWSGGKDSTASIILAHEHNEPLDLIIFSEVMFDENISGELPEHINFIKNKAIPLFKEWGYEVKILHSEKTYMDCFHHRTIRGKNTGMKSGFAMSGRCVVQRDCKLKPIREFWKNIDCCFIQYIGIAIDEPTRMERITNSENKVSLLEKYGYTEQMAFDLCKKYDLLSPIYDFAPRGGCWFCPNAKKNELNHLRIQYPELWNKLLELEDVPDTIEKIWNTKNRTSIQQKEEEFFEEDQELRIFDFEEGIGVNRLIVVEMFDGEIQGIPAEIIAYDYADHVAARDNSFKEAFNKMLQYFDQKDPIFESWARNNLTWEEIEDAAILFQCEKDLIEWSNEPETDNKCEETYSDCWKNRRYGYFSLSDIVQNNMVEDTCNGKEE